MPWNAVGTTSCHLVPCGYQFVMSVVPVSARQELNEKNRLSMTLIPSRFWVKQVGYTFLIVGGWALLQDFYCMLLALPRRIAPLFAKSSHAFPRRQASKMHEVLSAPLPHTPTEMRISYLIARSRCRASATCQPFYLFFVFFSRVRRCSLIVVVAVAELCGMVRLRKSTRMK